MTLHHDILLYVWKEWIEDCAEQVLENYCIEIWWFFWNSWEKIPLTPSAESLQPQFWERPNWSQFEALEEENNLPHQGESLINLEHFQNEHWSLKKLGVF